jgi:hypothetical protein
MFKTFGAGRPGEPPTPFRSGLSFSDRGHVGWKNGGLVFGTQAVFLVGGAVALADTAEPLVVAALAFMAVLAGLPQTLWGVRQVANEWTLAHQDRVLNCAFAAPFWAAAIAGLVVALW